MGARQAISAVIGSVADVQPLREQYRQEMNCQIVHDSIHRRHGWTTTSRLAVDGDTAGYGSNGCRRTVD